MKIVMTNLILSGVSLIVFSLILVGISNADLDPKTVVGMWLFNDGKGNTAMDSSENGNDGELVNGPNWVKNGKFGPALEFDGNKSKGHVAVGDLGLSGTVTLILWAKPNSIANDDRLISNISGPTNPAFTTRFQNGGVEIWSTAWKPVIPEVKNNQWGHYAFVFDGAGNVTGYYNGKEGSTVADAYVFTEIGIGANFLDQWGQYFLGIFDEIAFFNVALSEADINVLMTKGFESALVVYPASKLTTTWGNIKVSP